MQCPLLFHCAKNKSRSSKIIKKMFYVPAQMFVIVLKYLLKEVVRNLKVDCTNSILKIHIYKMIHKISKL